MYIQVFEHNRIAHIAFYGVLNVYVLVNFSFQLIVTLGQIY